MPDKTAVSSKVLGIVRDTRSVAERKQDGKKMRQLVPRETHASIKAIPFSQRDSISILEESNFGRVEALVPIRHERMKRNPFTFFRGSASLMAHDLSFTPNVGINLQICGDCHVLNFGGFATPERNIIIDINDFDETTHGPWEWDVKRLGASIVLAARSVNMRGGVGREAATTMAREYRKAMLKYAEMGSLNVWYARVDFHELIEELDYERRAQHKDNLQRAIEKSSPEVMLESLTEIVGGRRRFKDMAPLIQRMSPEELEIARDAHDKYIKTLPEDRRVLLDRYEVVDIARKVVGIGSVGTICVIGLWQASDRDYLITQAKQARRSVLEPYVPASPYEHQGQRVVIGQRIMQSASDILLGWTTGKVMGNEFFIRQLRDVKLSPNPANWKGRRHFNSAAATVGRVLAKAHARSGQPAVLAGYMGKNDVFEAAIANFSVAYADQTEQDYQMFLTACRTGRLVSVGS